MIPDPQGTVQRLRESQRLVRDVVLRSHGGAPNKGRETRLRDIEVAVMTELPTSKMGRGDVLWAVKGLGARGVRETFFETHSGTEVPPPLTAFNSGSATSVALSLSPSKAQ